MYTVHSIEYAVWSIIQYSGVYANANTGVIMCRRDTNRRHHPLFFRWYCHANNEKLRRRLRWHFNTWTPYQWMEYMLLHHTLLYLYGHVFHMLDNCWGRSVPIHRHTRNIMMLSCFQFRLAFICDCGCFCCPAISLPPHTDINFNMLDKKIERKRKRESEQKREQTSSLYLSTIAQIHGEFYHS